MIGGIVIMGLLLIAVALNIYHFLSGRRFVQDRLDAFWLRRMPLSQAIQHWARAPKSNLIITMTTIPSRMPHIELVLKSLLVQSVGPSRIKLYLPRYSKREGTPYVLPDYFSDIPALDVIRTDEYGPATKCIPALLSHPADQALLVVDDDKLYDRHLVSRMTTISHRFPDQVTASSGWRVPDDLIDKPTTLFRNLFLIPPTPIHASRIKKPIEVDIVMGCSGYLLRPRFFNLPDLIDRKGVPDALWFVDDVWISGHCQVKKFVHPAPRLCFEVLTLKSSFRRSSLTLINRNGRGGHRNNTIGIQYFSGRFKNQAGES